MGRSPCCSKEGMNRGAWTALEDKTLTDYIQSHGEGKWRNLPKHAGLKRCGKSCRLRWLNYLRPDIKRGNISSDEEDLIIRLHKLLGNRWSLIAGRLPGRTDNEIKNYWNTNLVKKVQSNHHHHHQNSPPDNSDNHSNGHDKNTSIKSKSTTTTTSTTMEPPPPINIEPPPLVQHGDVAALLRSTHQYPVPAERVLDHDDHVPMLTRDINGLSPPENFMVGEDFTMAAGDLRLSDLIINSDHQFSDLGVFNRIKNDNVDDHNDSNRLSSSSPPPPSSDFLADLVFSSEMLEDWALCDQNVGSDNLINSFSSFLDSEDGDWS